MTDILLPAYSLWRREIVRFLRQRNRVFSALLQPVLFWGLFGAGFRGSFQVPGAGDPGAGPGTGGQGFLEYLFPGTVVMILLFTAIFATVSVIQDRKEGFLQSVLVAPVAPLGIVLGKVGGGATLALGQGLLFLCLAPLAGVPLSVGTFLASVGLLAILSLALTGVGLLVAWPMDSTQGYHAVMMLVLMPMWLLSGAFFPLVGLPGWLDFVMRANPLTYGVAAFRQTLYGADLAGHGLPAPHVSWAVTIGFAVLSLGAASLLVGRRAKGATG